KENMRDEFLVDYSPINQILRVPVTSAKDVANAEINGGSSPFAGRLVLIGNADTEQEKENSFSVAGRTKTYPGVYLHACATNTLIKTTPLRIPTPLGRALLDMFAATAMLSTIRIVYTLHASRLGRLSHPGVLRAAILMSILCVVGGAWLMAKVWRIVWDGALVVSVALLLHEYGDWIGHSIIVGLRAMAFAMIYRSGLRPPPEGSIGVGWKSTGLVVLI